MTRTYSDPEALTRLLEEKERDLELAAHIGQGLLREKQQLVCRSDALESELLQAQEALTQLRHELALKASLLEVYTAQEEADSALPSPTEGDDVPVSTLTRKIHQLEQENSQLKAESQSQLSNLEEEEKKELQLIRDCVRQLSDVTKESSHLQEELCRRTEVNLRQQQEILTLNAQLSDMQRYAQSLRAEADELRAQLAMSRGLQEQQSEELLEARARYLDLKEAFLELQAQLRQRQNEEPTLSARQSTIWGGASSRAGASTSTSNPPSLGSELQACLADQGDQVQIGSCTGGPDGLPPFKPTCSPWSQSEESEESDCNDSQYSSLSSLGLSPRKERRVSNRRLLPGLWGGATARPFRFSDKLLMVKPLEGSETLKQWQRLATPGLSDLFEDQGSGVRLKGGLAVQPPLEPLHHSPEGDQDEMDHKGLAGKAGRGLPDGVALRCWVQSPGWEPEAPWLRLQACLSKLNSGSSESQVPSVLLRTQQEKPVPGTPPSSPVVQRRATSRLLRSYRASQGAHSPARPSKLAILHEGEIATVTQQTASQLSLLQRGDQSTS